MSAPVVTDTFAAAVDRDVVTVAGTDAARYLEGQISQSVDALAVGTSTWSFVLAPQGRCDAWFRITKTAADAFLLDVDGGYGPALVERLRRYLIRTDAAVEPLAWSAVAVRGPDVPRDELDGDVLRLPVAGPGVAGYDLLGAVVEPPDGLPLVAEEVLEGYRVVHGVPRMGAEITESTIPAELGPWIIECSVDFAKGCFTGQELTARIDSRGGNVPHQLRVLRLDAPVAVAAVGDTGSSGAAAAVEITSVAETAEHGPVALARCGRAVEVGDTVHVAGVAGVVHAPPLD